MTDDAARAEVTTARAETDVHLHISSRTVLRILVILALFALFVAALRTLAPLLVQLMVAAFVAIAADSVVRTLQRYGLRRGQAILVVIVGALVAVALMAAVFVPPVVDQGQKLIDDAPNYIEDIRSSSLYESLDRRFDLGNSLTSQLNNKISDVPDQLGGAFGKVVGGVFSGVTFVFMVTFLLLSGGSVMNSTLRLFPRLTDRMWWEVIRGAYRNIGAYVVGAATIALIAGVSMTVVLLIVGTPFALPLGLWMLLLDLIPLVGATIGAVPAVLVSFIAGGPVDGIIVLAFVIVYQQIENTVIQPRIQGRGASLSALTIFLSVLIGSNLLGVVGALFAVPVASVLAIIYHQYLAIVGRADMELPSLFEDAPTSGEIPGPPTS